MEKSKGFYKTEAKVLTFHQVKCVKRESPTNKGALVHSGLFLTVFLGLDVMKGMGDTHEAP